MMQYDKMTDIIPIPNGLGDNIVFNEVICEMKAICEGRKIIIGTLYPDVYKNNPYVTTIDIYKAIECGDIDSFNVYKFMTLNKWRGSLSSAYRKILVDRLCSSEAIKKILISPYSKKVVTLNNNAKNYQYFSELIELLNKNNFYTIQVGIKDEPLIGCEEIKFDKSLDELSILIMDCHTWISVDNFFHHLAWKLNKRGNVIFGPSDPLVYGHPENNNILKDRKYLHPNQFAIWENIVFNEHAFENAEIIFRKLQFL
jgi:hypothetical protein